MSFLANDKFVCVVGTSTAFAYWAFGVAAHAMQETFGEFLRVHCTSVAELKMQWSERGHRSVLFTTDVLDEPLSALLNNSGASIVAVTDNAETAILTAAELRGLSCLDAIRLSSRYIASLAGVLDEPRTKVFAGEARAMRVADFVPRFLAALSLADPDLAGRVLQRLGASETSTVDEAVKSTQPDVGHVATTWSTREREACRRIAAEYQKILDRKPVKQMIWPAALHHAATPEFQTETALDLLGPARLLIWGPYLHLPKGRWRATMEFEVTGNLSPNRVIADVLVGGEFAGLGKFDLPERGIFTWSLAFAVADVEKAIEVRLTLEKAAIEGALLLRQVQLRALADLRAPLFDIAAKARIPLQQIARRFAESSSY